MPTKTLIATLIRLALVAPGSVQAATTTAIDVAPDGQQANGAPTAVAVSAPAASA